MKTTAVFAEVLAIGIQAVGLVGLAFAAFADPLPALDQAAGWEAALTIALLAFAYVLGVVVDRVADSLFTPLRNRTSRHDAAARARARHLMLRQESPLATFLEYQRSRMRLMRGTMLNLLVALPVVMAFLAYRAPDAHWTAYVLALGAIVLLLVACYYAFVAIIHAQDKWLHIVEAGEPRRQERKASRPRPAQLMDE